MVEIITAEANEIEIKQSAVEEYLGYFGAKADENLLPLIDECKKEFLECVDYKACVSQVNCCEKDGKICLDFMQSESKSLKGNLKNCETAFVFAATTGVAVQRLIAKNSLISPVKGMITDSIGSAAIEAFCDYINRKVGNVDYLRPRFSPGYGDLSLECQQALLDFVDAKKHIGLALTESRMLTPVKSVTAIIGLSKEKNKCKNKKGCMVCNRINCPYS